MNEGHVYEYIRKCISRGLSIFGMERFQQKIKANVNHGIEFWHKTYNKRNTCAWSFG